MKWPADKIERRQIGILNVPGRGQLDSGDRAPLGIANPRSDAVGHLLGLGHVLGLQMGDPNGANW
jgi:hypothetical protein